MRTRFRPVAPQRPDVSAVIREAIGEFLFRRSRDPVGPEFHLSWVGISRTDLEDIIAIAWGQLDEDGDRDVIKLDPALHIDTVADLVAAIETLLPSTVEDVEPLDGELP